VGESRGAAPPRSRDALLLVALLWIWAVPAALLWHWSVSRDALLPYLPRAVWFAPGELWRRWPPVLAAALILLSGLSLGPWGRARRLGALRPYLVATLLLIVLVHVLWGGALIVALREE
jgi:hypothetical protein